jgi:hypothetical protein
MDNLNFESSAVHIALATYPIGDEIGFRRHLDSIYSKFKANVHPGTNTGTEFYYTPYRYHIFGHYNVCYISLIDNYKFAQRVFSNTQFPKNAFSYQIQTGSLLNPIPINKFNKDLLDYIYLEYPYIQITNFKLSNGLLIGNGADFKNVVISKLHKKLHPHIINSQYLLLNSFNWSDITLILISKIPRLPFDIIYDLRSLTFNDLFSEKEEIKSSEIIENSFYYSVLGFQNEEIKKSHVFADTHSYYGFALDIFKETNATNKYFNDEFHTLMEIEEKPGHLRNFATSLIENNLISNSILDKIGKTDYIITEPLRNIQNKDQRNSLINDPLNSLRSKHKIFHHIIDNKLYEHIKRLKTTPIFELTNAQIEQPILKEGIFNISKTLVKLIFKNQKEEEILLIALKKLNFSRQLRTKIRKVLHSYKIGITDNILFIYFIDFMPYIKFLKSHILQKAKQQDRLILNGEYPDLADPDGLNVNRMESNFDSILKAFEEAYDDRILNNYQFEDINDYSIDFNTSITQIISTTDSLIKMISPSLFETDGKLLIRQNELNTVSNIISINYNVFHLLEPPFVVNTIVKEILNSFEFHLHKNDKSAKIINNCKHILKEELYQRHQLDPFEDMIYNNFKIIYYEIDVIKYFYTFNGNIELYIFWSWTHFLQHTGVYSSVGYIDEKHFINELLRIMLITAVFEKEYFEKDSLACPIPELYSYWEKDYHKIKILVKKIISLNHFTKLTTALVYEFTNETLNYLADTKKGSRINALISMLQGKFDSLQNSNQSKTNKLFKNIEDNFDRFSITQKLEKYLNKKNKNRKKLLNIWLSIEMFNLQYRSDLEQGKSIIFNKSFVNDPSDFNETKKEMMNLFFNCLSYTILSWYFEKMNGKIHLLRRDYATGEPILEFVQENKNVFLFVDPNGDFYTPDSDSRQQLMKFKHTVFYSLWHLGVVFKKQIFQNNIKK